MGKFHCFEDEYAMCVYYVSSSFVVQIFVPHVLKNKNKNRYNNKKWKYTSEIFIVK